MEEASIGRTSHEEAWRERGTRRETGHHQLERTLAELAVKPILTV
jgi:hypothetical protein